MFRRYRVLVVFALLMTGLPGVAVAGPVMIDSFNVGQGQQVQVLEDNTADTSSSSPLDTDQVIGGVRRMDIPGSEPVSGANPNVTGLRVIVDDGELSYDSDTFVKGSTVLTYNAGGLGLGGGDGVSLIPTIPGGFNPYFAFEITFIDQGDIRINVGVTDAGSNSATATWTGTDTGLAKLPFSLFSDENPSINFNLITAITLEIVNLDAAQDLKLDSFYTSAEVPEPSTVALFVLGAAAFYGTARLRNRKRKSKS